MKKTLLTTGILGLSLLLAGCPSEQVSVGSSGQSVTASGLSMLLAAGPSCNTQEIGIFRGGGKFAFPSLDGDYAAIFHYTGYVGRGRDIDTKIGEANYDCWNVPVPTGYTAVWFGYFAPDTTGMQFKDETTGLCKIQSSSFQAGTQYYLYIYDGYASSNQIYSSAIGTPTSKGELKFNSPFENGFFVPSTIVLEIAHA
jgi:hypothetical protein